MIVYGSRPISVLQTQISVLIVGNYHSAVTRGKLDDESGENGDKLLFGTIHTMCNNDRILSKNT